MIWVVGIWEFGGKEVGEFVVSWEVIRVVGVKVVNGFVVGEREEGIWVVGTILVGIMEVEDWEEIWSNSIQYFLFFHSRRMDLNFQE